MEISDGITFYRRQWCHTLFWQEEKREGQSCHFLLAAHYAIFQSNLI